MAITSDFQSEDVGSIPITCSIKKNQAKRGAYKNDERQGNMSTM
jgi:hypothetical protein